MSAPSADVRLSEQHGLRRWIEGLARVADMHLLLVPKGMCFRIPVDEARMERAASIYEIADRSCRAHHRVLDLVLGGNAPYDLQDLRLLKNLRVGVVFKRDQVTLGGIYYGEPMNLGFAPTFLEGLSLRSSQSVPDSLREVVPAAGIRLVKARRSSS